MACMYGYTDLWIDFLREFEIEEALETVVKYNVTMYVRR